MDSHHKYGKFYRDINKTACTQCGKMLSGLRVSNLKRHYEKIHFVKINTGPQDISSASDNDDTLEPKTKKKAVSSFVMEMDRNKFLKCCIGMLIVKHIPFRIFDDEQYFKELIAPYERKCGTNLTSKSILGHIKGAAVRIKELLAERLEHKMISIKLDIATQLEKSVLAVNVQYINDFKIHIHTLDIIQLEAQQNEAALQTEIMQCLRLYNIDMRQVYCKTTDSDSDSSAAMTSEALSEIKQEHIDEATPAITHMPTAGLAENVHAALASALAVEHCVAHTLHLVAHDVLPDMQGDLDECRSAVKLLRVLIKSGALNGDVPALDNDASWLSTVDMLKSLQNIKNSLDCGQIDFGENQLELEWQFVANAVAAFSPLAECAKKLHNEQYVFGDFYRDWLTYELEVEELSDTNPYAGLLYTAMTIRRDELLRNEICLAALYLDRRFNYANSPMLTEEQKSTAIRQLTQTFEVMQTLGEAEEDSAKPFVINEAKSLADSSLLSDAPSSSQDSYKKLQQRMNAMKAQAESTPMSQRSIKQKLLALSCVEQLPLDTDVLQAWKTHCYDRDLKRLAQVVLSAPASQVSLERTHSALSLILHELEGKHTHKTINSILLTKLNFELLEPAEVDLK